MPTQIQYYNSSPAMTGVLHPQTAQYSRQPVRPWDPYPPHPPARIVPATGFHHRSLSAPLDRPTWNDPRHGRVASPPAWPRVGPRRQPFQSSLGRRAPFAARTMDLGLYSRGRHVNGRMGSLPPYAPFNDPHLLDYYTRKFAMEPRPPSTAGRSGSARSTRGGVLYTVTVKTGDCKNAGTQARVYLQMKGSKGRVNKKRLYKKSSSGIGDFRFGRGSSHTFRLHGPELGELKAITLEHDGLEERDAWFVEEVSVTSASRARTWTLLCHCWLSLHRSDCQISRTFTPLARESHTVYEVVTVTGDVRGASTDANVFVTLFGERGSTAKLQLASTGKDCFERGKTDTFKVKANCVGPLRKIRVEHDNRGSAPGWFLERVVVTDVSRPGARCFFPCGQWLSRDEGDGRTARDLLGSPDPMHAPRKPKKYEVTVFTGDERGAGTDADVSISIFGELGDTGERRLDSRRNNFERGKQDKFTLDSPNLGRLTKISIGHNNRGPSPGWFLDKVVVDDRDAGVVYQFPVRRWLSEDEDDGRIRREIPVAGGSVTDGGVAGTLYTLRVLTGDKRGAGTDARVYAVLHGAGVGGARPGSSGRLELRGGSFERGGTDVFQLEAGRDVASPLARITVGHDNSGAAPGWFCEKTFPCGRWLDRREGDGLIECELLEDLSLRKTVAKRQPCSVWVHTSDVRNAGTDANVRFQLYGERGHSEEILLDNKSDNFERGQTDKFTVELPDLGPLYKMRVWHDCTHPFAGWHLDKVTVWIASGRERYTFKCGRWLDVNEGDGEIVRELPAEGPSVRQPLPVVQYAVLVETGKCAGAGTDAAVSLCLYGERGDTGNRVLQRSSSHRNKFERGNTDEFVLEAVSLGRLDRVRIGHDGKGASAGWFLERVEVRDKSRPEGPAQVFPCSRWLSEGEDDGQIVRELLPSGHSQILKNISYHVKVRTGDVRNAGTDANVYVRLVGEAGETAKIPLRTSANKTGNKFERGRVDVFTIEGGDIGKVRRLVIGHDDSGPGAGWFLEGVEVEVPAQGLAYTFPCGRWLASDEGDRRTEVELQPGQVQERNKLINYEVTVRTGDVRGAGTDAAVFVQLYGERGKTEQKTLASRSDSFEKGATDVFKLEAEDVGRLVKLRVGHDDKGLSSAWFLDSVTVRRFRGKRDLAAAAAGGTRTNGEAGAGRRDGSRRGSLAGVAAPMASLSGKGPGGEAAGAADGDVETYTFACRRWLARNEDDGQVVRELLPQEGSNLKECTYSVHVFTGDVRGAGSNANVFITVYGTAGDSGERQLRDSEKHRNKFERANEDVFTVAAVDLGELKKVRLRHDNSGVSAGWFLDRVEVTEQTSQRKYVFPCGRWLAVDEDDGQVARELVAQDPARAKAPALGSAKRPKSSASLSLEQKAQLTTYNIKVKTGDKRGSGTDANVFMVLYGEKDDTGKVNLKSSKTNKNKFEKGQIDEFTLEAVDIGALKKIKIGHDNAGLSAGWFLDWVEVDAPSLGQRLRFACARWLDADEDDGSTERELFPAEPSSEHYAPHVPYEITARTSDVPSAGTDADVFVVLYGRDGSCTRQASLCPSKKQRKEHFNRGSVDTFVLELEDVGDAIEKVRVGHDNAGLSAGWHLDRLDVRRLLGGGKGSETLSFPCGRWLARSEDDGEVVRELVPRAVVQERVLRDGSLKRAESVLDDVLQTHKYKVRVHTGSVRGAGTDANVFVTLYGDQGDSGERKLSKSETHSNKFEKGQEDIFTLEAVDLGRIHKIKVRHDNSMPSPDWFLSKVEVEDLDTDEVFLFTCERWLSKDKEDKKLERTFYVKGYDGEKSSVGSSVRSLRSSAGGSLRGAANQAAPSASSRRRSIVEDTIYEGPTRRREVTNDAASSPAALPYHVAVTTGREKAQGAPGRAFVVVWGRAERRTPRLWLDNADGPVVFSPGSTRSFRLESLDVGDVTSVELGHDGTSSSESSWFVDEFTLSLPTRGVAFRFPCHCWLSRTRADGQTARVFNVRDAELANSKPKVSYEVTVVTGDSPGAGTDTGLHVTLFGANGATPEVTLAKGEDRFERGHKDVFAMEMDDVGRLEKMRVRSDGKGSRPDWFLEKILLRNVKTFEVTAFKLSGWISKSKGDKKLVWELPAVAGAGNDPPSKTTYTIAVKTSKVRGAATDANVFVALHGDAGDSGPLALSSSLSGGNKFESGRTDEFRFADHKSLGRLSRLRVWHDSKGLGAGWHLAEIEVRDEVAGQTFTFPCNRWLADDEDDKKTERELTCAGSHSRA
ncbi:lipoxygenase homology domain-containing protein 1-like isoform X3 [Lethenteron reissneri]|uniref:lipoxygenase homology domain-containing protein 1-like isoform X3 n=1 Tax=Lethenteron reissneri TaxID=7753 RepID=UPI002AB65D99|nr:lipoxygenase homology domain-containing protein 1-like isoform X3 [Lethenteron reissneri]